MTLKIIGIIQVKGGAGRSTVSTNLAGELSKRGKTILIDCDMPQGTSASWWSVRPQPGNLFADTARTHKELIAKVEQNKDAAFIVLDGPPRIAELTKAILILSDLCIVPIGASVAEVWATTDLLTLIADANKITKVKARLLFTRHRPKTKLAITIEALAKKELAIPTLKTSLGLRVAYPEALGEGLTVAEMRDPSAKAEIKQLTTEVFKLL